MSEKGIIFVIKRNRYKLMKEIIMDSLEIEFEQSSTGSYSPWHLKLVDEYDIPLICTADIGHFVKVGEDIYKIYNLNDYYDLYEYFCDLEKKNDKGEISDEDVLSLIDVALSDSKKVRKCISLEEFKNHLITLKNKRMVL